LLENELRQIEQKYKETREKVNTLRDQHLQAKNKTKDIQNQSKEFSEYIQHKRDKRHNQIISINDDQQNKLSKLDAEEAKAQSLHDERIRQIDSEIRAEEFRRTKLLDSLNKLSDVMRLKDKNDARILELEQDFSRIQIEDAEKLQQLKYACLEAKKDFEILTQESAKDAQSKLNIEARKMVAERTEAARRLNRDLRQKLVELVAQGKMLANRKRSVEEQQRKVKAEIQYLKSQDR